MSKIPTSLPSSVAGLGSQIMTPPQYVKVSEITADSVMQHRAVTHDKVIEEYADVFRNGGELAPVQIVRDENGTLWLWDGFHTLEAAKRAGVEKLRVKITPGTKRDAWLNSLGANAKHGIRRSRVDLQKTVDDALHDPEVKFSLLNEDQQHNYSSIARLCRVHHSTVSNRWNNYHLPLILAEIDREVRGDPPFGVSLQEWLNMVAKDLHVPAWLVKQRKIEIGFKPKPPPIPAQEPSAPKAREIVGDHEAPTSRVEPSDSPIEPVAREIADGQTSPASRGSESVPVALKHHETRAQEPSAPKAREIVGDHEAPTSRVEPSDSPIEPVAREIADGQTSPASRGSESVPVALKHHETRAHEASAPKGIYSHQTNHALSPPSEPPIKMLSVEPENVVVHDPVRNQRYDGQELTTILTNVASQEYGAKVIEARRPVSGWSQETGKEIGRVFANATSDETELAAVLVVLIQK